jgi:hypothetical protein
MIDADQTKWLERYYANLEGFTVEETGIGSDGFPFLIMRKGEEVLKIEVSRDEEGNGAGFLFGLPLG